MLIFPITSGVIATVAKLDVVETLVLQGGFMAASLIIPVAIIISGKWHFEDVGLNRFDSASNKRLFYYLPFVLIFVPVAVRGFTVTSIEYFFGALFLYLMVGIAEEVYFRGIIPMILRRDYNIVGVIVISSIIFGLGHVASAFTSNDALEIGLSVLNALIFGFMAIELAIIAKNIIPGIIIHFIFDFETKIIIMSGQELMIAELVRGAIMVLIAVWLALVIYKNKDQYSQK